MKKALFFEKQKHGKVQCLLCPHQCILEGGEWGICRVRKNAEGALYTDNYEKLSALALDPVSKKPLYHFYPGKNILSIGTVGCNLRCEFCQNYEISQSSVSGYSYLNNYNSEELVQIALNQPGNIGIAYTYNEPVVWYEFVVETAKLAKKAALKNVMVTNGFINTEALKYLIQYMDAFSIDLKGFTDEFYRKYTSSSLNPVKESIKLIYKSGKHLELVNLVITDVNDDEETFRKMVDWIATELSKDVVLHISRYFPMFKLNNLPTSKFKLETLYHIAREKLNYVYLGNISTSKGQDTYCPNCGENLISRAGYNTAVKALNNAGECQKCGHLVLHKQEVS